MAQDRMAVMGMLLDTAAIVAVAETVVAEKALSTKTLLMVKSLDAKAWPSAVVLIPKLV
jgi:hypothetical protein